MQGKKIILAVTGSIAAYKAVLLMRLLIKQGASVRVLMTESATRFVAPLTFSTLSDHPVITSVSDEAGWNNHVELGLWADLIVVAPATAHTLSRLSLGLCNDIVSAVYLSARCKTVIAPAMDLDMWVHPATQRHVTQLKADGCLFIDPTHGQLASGLVGTGRLAEPEDIATFLTNYFATSQDLAGKHIVITAGPTYEAIDPVRFIGNHSTGKMGIALADAAASRGGLVTLILGPTHLRPQHPGVCTILVKSAQEMFDQATKAWPKSDIGIMTAAVADYRPSIVSDVKIKKQKGEGFTIDLVQNPDIAATLGAQKQPNQVLIGFALETNDELTHARRKLETKRFDLVVLNSLRDAGAGFGHDTNVVTLITATEQIALPQLPKTEVAQKILDQIGHLQSK
jgi:phosphopantothenoylcysteine decarboxylase / phosphopantothenate---cysteine ligase